MKVFQKTVSSPLKLGKGGFLFLKFGQRGVMKKLLINRGLVEREGLLRKRGISKLFPQFSFREACFHYYWIFSVW